jgi:hypothetical protein
MRRAAAWKKKSRRSLYVTQKKGHVCTKCVKHQTEPTAVNGNTHRYRKRWKEKVWEPVTGNPYTIEKEKQNRTDLNQELRKKKESTCHTMTEARKG